ncbi:TraB/GumN family protein [Lysobacter sp. A286]
MQPVKIVLAGLLAVCATVSAGAVGTVEALQDTLPPPGVEIAELPPYSPPVPLLWKVSDADNAIYLLGSFHLLKQDDYPLSGDIDAAYELADRIVFEVAPAELDDPTTGQKFLEAAGYEDGRVLADVLPPRLREKLHRLLARQGSGLEQVNQYNPWFVNLSLMLGLSRSLGFSAELGLDRHLMERAASSGKPTSGLESIDDQLQALDAAPMHEQVIGLKDFIDRPQEMPAMLADLHQVWRDGDIEALDALTRQEMLEKTPQTYRAINQERNLSWLPQLRQMLDENHHDDVMVVVGALHLLGDDGVVELLRDHGYQVERICSACEAALSDSIPPPEGPQTPS